MARVSNKEGIAAVGGSQFDLITIAAHRGRQYSKGVRPLINQPGGRGMTALREIEQGLVGREVLDDIVNKYSYVKPKTAIEDSDDDN